MADVYSGSFPSASSPKTVPASKRLYQKEEMERHGQDVIKLFTVATTVATTVTNHQVDVVLIIEVVNDNLLLPHQAIPRSSFCMGIREGPLLVKPY